jgi:hypothetical protein
MSPLSKLLVFVALMMIAAPVLSQQSKTGYTGSLEAALVNGGYESNAAITMTHGLGFKGITASVGAGIDYYRFRSVPVFIDLKKYFTIAKLQPFIQASAGLNVAWPTTEQKIVQRWWWQGNDTISFSNGIYSKAVMGIVLNPGKQVKISAVAGWSYKSVTTRYDELVFDGTGSRMEIRTMIFGLNRLYVGLGVSF